MSLAEILVGPIAHLLDKFIPDKDARERMAHEIATMAEAHAHEQSMGQIEVNKVEAAHKSLFVAGWRPFIGWSLGVALSFNFLAAPLINYCTALFHVTAELNGQQILVVVPTLDLTQMMPVLLGMLGLGSMRTVEKIKGVAREK